MAVDFPTEILLIFADLFTENDLSTELGVSWGSGNFGEHVLDVDKRRKTLARNPRRSTVFCRRFMEGSRGRPARSSNFFFANTKSR